MLMKRCWKQVVTFVSVKSAKDDLITVGITSGAKLARTQHRLLYGTREVAIDVMSCENHQHRRILWGSSDGLSYSSDEVSEREWSEELSLFCFCSSDNQRYIHNVVNTFVINRKSRMKGDLHVRFRENRRVKLPSVTRLCPMPRQRFSMNNLVASDDNFS